MADDRRIARLAARQKRVVTAEQLRAADFTWSAIRHRLGEGTLQRLWWGIYLLGPGKPDDDALAMAGILTCGDAALGYHWAGRRWGFIAGPSLPVDVIVVAGSHRGRAEVRVHRTVLVNPRDFTRKDDLPLTTPARTLLDLASVVSSYALERAVAEAMVLKLVNQRHLTEVIARSGRHPGVAHLRRALQAGPDLTRSEAERIFRRLLKAAGLPAPRANYRIGKYEVDFYFPSHSVVVEIDGLGPHGTPQAFERDRRKRSELAAAGYKVLPFTYRQLTEEPAWVVAQIATALSRT